MANRFFGVSILLCLIVTPSFLLSQDKDSSFLEKFTISGLVDTYYQLDLDDPREHYRPDYLYSYKRENEFAINLAMLKVNYTDAHIHGNLAFMTGNYAEYNYAAEPTLYRFIYEANVGINLNKKMSIDAGILPSHIGIESAIAKDCWNLTRSLVAENSPYFETGIKFNYTPNQKWTGSFLLLNGWQNIIETNSNKAIGTQIQYKPKNDKWLFNSSTFFGNEKPDSAKQFRIFHDFYATFAATKKLNLSFTFDIGAEQNATRTKYNVWHAAALLAQYSLNKKWKIAGRIEEYHDPKNVIVSVNSPNGFSTFGYSLNGDFKPFPHFLWRIEGRAFNAKNKVFVLNHQAYNHNYTILTSAAVYF